MLKFLNRPYPFNDDLKSNAKIILLVSFGVLVFMLIVQPINISAFSMKQIVYLLGEFVVPTFIILTFNLIILPSIFPIFFDNSKWDIKREISWILWILLLISGSNFFFYTKLFPLSNVTLLGVGKIILLGTFVIVALITLNQNRLLRYNLRTAQQLNKKLLDSKQRKQKLIHFESDYKKDSLVIKSESLILIKSADNYIEVYYQNQEAPQKQMIRVSLQKVEKMLSEFDFIKRCHRSFIVNINFIKDIQGNSQGYKLYFEGIDFPALVSQTYINEFNKII